MRRRGRPAVGQAAAKQQLLVSVQPRSGHVLVVRVVEPQEGQDGLGEPQGRHAPQRRLRTESEN